MGSFNLLHKRDQLKPFTVNNDDILAPADAKIAVVEMIADPVFAQKVMGETIAFIFDKDKVILCSPANGTLSVLFPTGHAFGVTMEDGTELLVHCGLDTVKSKDGFRILKKKQGDLVKAGDPLVEVDLKKLRTKYDTTTMLIITENPKALKFKELIQVSRGQELI